MEWKNTLAFLLTFLIAFALGYLIDVPSEIDVNFNIDDDVVQMTENMQNLTYNCPNCVCECVNDRTTPIYWDAYETTKDSEGNI